MIETVSLELTRSCNLRCVHCFQEHRTVHMDASLALRIIDNIDPLGAGQVVLTGGEPTLHPEFGRIYRHARESGYLVNLFTNGVKYPTAAWEALEASPPHIVSLTLYGLDQGTFTAVTGRMSSYQGPFETIRRFMEMGSDVYLRYHAIKQTRDSVGQFIDLAQRLECDYSVNVQLIPMLDGTTTNLAHRLSGDEVRAVEAECHLDFTPDDPSLAGQCDLGQNLYVTAEGKLQGCPIYEAVSEPLDPANMSDQVATLAAAGEYLRTHQELSRGVCPAWLHLEGPQRVKSFLQEIGASGL